MNSPEQEWQAILDALPRMRVHSTTLPPETAGMFVLDNGRMRALALEKTTAICGGCVAEYIKGCDSLPSCTGGVWADLTPERYAKWLAGKLSGGGS